MLAAVLAGLTLGGGIARFEFKTSNIESKLDTMIAMIDTNKVHNSRRFVAIEQKLIAQELDIKSITTSLTAITAFIKPDDVRLTNKRR
jgi:hypothetical protein